MFYLEIVQDNMGEENHLCQLHSTFTDVKNALAQSTWVRYVIIPLTVK